MTDALPARRLGPTEFVVDCDVLVRRNLRAIRRVPQMLVAVVVQPLMFVLLFSYVFGEALGGDTYRQFLIGGIMTQTVAFNAAFSALGIATDMDHGIVDRFRALPMSRLSFIASRTISDIAINVISLLVMTLAGYMIGWRIVGDAGGVMAGYAIALFFGFALSWVGAVIGIVSASMQAAQSLVLTVLFPLTFISSAFIPSSRLPTALQIVANWNPVTSVARTLREAFGNPTSVSAFIAEPVTWAGQHPAVYSFLACVVISAAAAPLSVAALKSSTR
ncbi:ABC transporter permease [Gordonia soli]|uniref:Transport permease protein n=1 Tax=Gordonia soli NBRC 108243 TaxID=1223545 RepID=M0QIU5_9ACTN|nr:ABC transporter permease [Gordonia soli]GAC68473.1 putative ABC transporter permease protein [Gordonia soli NBRC 108243]